MTRILSEVREPSFFHRQFDNDINKPKKAETAFDQCKRVALVALPFISLCKPLGKSLSLATDGLRSLSSLATVIEGCQKGDARQIASGFLNTTASAASIAGTIFAHPVGMLITTGHDIALNASQVIHALSEQDYKKAAEMGAHLTGSILYLGMFFTGAIELSLMASSIQILIGLYRSADDLQKGNYLEAGGHMMMSAIRTHQLRPQINALQFKWKLPALAMPLAASPTLGMAANAQANEVKNDTLPLPKAGDKPAVYHSDPSGKLKKTQLESIHSAKKSVLIMTFTLSDMEVINALNKKAEEGLAVTVIMNKDHMGTIKAFGHPKIKLLTRTEGEGRYHHKILVIDQALTWLGSANFSSDALTTQANTMTIIHNEELGSYLYQEIDVMQGLKKREKKAPPIITAGGQKLELLFSPTSLKIRRILRNSTSISMGRRGSWN